jgi:hypothetical protein
VEDGLQLEQLPPGHQRVDGGVLERHPDGAAHLARFTDHVEAGHPGRAVAGREQGGQHPDRGRLARPVRAQEAEDLALGHLQVHTVDRGQVAEATHQPTRFDRMCHDAPHLDGGANLSTWQ